jgi:tRNA threonylcarbamoyladenosine biosynthesis protein TsaB
MLLAIDTSTAQIGIALYDGAQVLAESVWISKQHHTTQLAPALAGLLSRTSVSMDMVSALGVALGPGSFTSLRVGLALVKGIALARKLPVIGISTMDVIAVAQPFSKLPLAVVLQAGRGKLALGLYKSSKNGWQAQGPARVMTVDALVDEIESPTIIAGELSAEERQRLARKKVNIKLASPAQCVRRPAILAELAWVRWQAGKVDDVASLAPVYLHVAGSTPL